MSAVTLASDRPPASSGSSPKTAWSFARQVLPGLALCIAVTVAALAAEHVEAAVFGRAWLEALVLAILIDAAIRTAWTPARRWNYGIAFSAKTLL